MRLVGTLSQKGVHLTTCEALVTRINCGIMSYNKESNRYATPAMLCNHLRHRLGRSIPYSSTPTIQH